MAAHAVTEATPPGEVDGLSLRRKAVPPGSLPLVPLAAFRQLKQGLRCHQTTPRHRTNEGPISSLPPRAVAHDDHLRACARQSAAAPRGQPGRQLALADSRVAVLGAASHGSRTDGSASGRGAPGTLPAVSPAEMGVWAEPRAGGAAPTPI